MKTEITALVHCETEIEQIGLQQIATHLPFRLSLLFMNLTGSGIRQKISKNPDIIILDMWDADTNYSLPHKIKLFAPHIPLLLLLPEVPESFIYFLRSVMVDKILQKPFSQHAFESAIRQLIH